MSDLHGKLELNRAYDGLERHLPERPSRWLAWLRTPRARRVRLAVGALLILASFLWFLPVLGLWMLPLGLLLVAQDVPFLRRPVAGAVLWGLTQWRALRRWWQRRRGVG